VHCKNLKGTKHYKLVLGVYRNCMQEPLQEETHRVIAYSNADFANCVTTGRSVSGLAIIFDDSPVMWATREQPIVTKPTTAAEYVAALQTASEAIHVSKLLDGLKVLCRPVPLVCDYQAAPHLISNPVENGRSKFLAVHWHFVRERSAVGDVKMV
jgi:hypothetical protein